MLTLFQLVSIMQVSQMFWNIVSQMAWSKVREKWQIGLWPLVESVHLAAGRLVGGHMIVLASH